MKANATVSVRRNAVQNKKARTTGKVRTKKHTGSPLSQASADLPEQQRVCWKMVMYAYGKQNWDYPDPRCPEAPKMFNDICII